MVTAKILGVLAVVAGLTCPSWGQKLAIAKVKGTDAIAVPALQGPSKSASLQTTPVSKDEPTAPKPEIHFDPATRMVTVKLLIEDSNGRFLPDIRRDNFAVFENGVRQQNPDIEVDHAPVSIALLMQWGGRYHALNEEMYDEIPRAAHQLLAELGTQDKIAIWKYGDRPEQIAGFSQGRDTLDEIFLNLNQPEFSETNLYDALVATLGRMRSVSGRKALVLISSGIDTFSKASYQDALTAARESNTPVYVVNVGPALRSTIDLSSQGGPYARLDWPRAERQLQEIARTSGGRLYSPNSTFDLSGVYDDMMENLRVRYVIRYQSPAADSPRARTVRIDLIDPKTGGPVQVLDAKGKPAAAKFSVQGMYKPHVAALTVAGAPSAATQQ